MRCKQIGIMLIALGVGVIVTLIFPVWLLVFLLGLILIGVGYIIC